MASIRGRKTVGFCLVVWCSEYLRMVFDFFFELTKLKKSLLEKFSEKSERISFPNEFEQ